MSSSSVPLILRPSRARFGVLGFACSLSLITYLDRICIMRARADVQHDLGFSTTQMGWVFAAFSLGYMLFEVPGGMMGDAWGPRRVLTRIVLCWSFFTAMTGCVWAWNVGGFSLGLVALLLVRFLFGVGEAGAYPTLTRVTSDWFPTSERAAAQGAIWWSARVGGAVAPLVLGRIAVALGWRQAFYVLGVIGLAWAWLFWRWFRDRPAQHPACNEAERRLIEAGSPPREGHAHPIPTFADVRPALLTVVAACWASFWVCFGWYFYPTWQPAYLEEVHGFKPTGWASEVLSGLPFLCGAFGALGGGALSDRLVRRIGPRWGRSLIGLVGFSGAGACVLATGFVPTAWAAVTLLCLAFLINDLAIPVLWAVCADVGGRFAGSLSGLMNMIGAVGAILCPLLIPYVNEWLKSSFATPDLRWRVIFAGLAGAWGLAAAAWLFIDASRRMGHPSVNSDPSSVIGGPGVTVVVRCEERVTSKPDGVQVRTEGIRSDS
jgi:ACS family glucarate transporter-like MFS transporter